MGWTIIGKGTTAGADFPLGQAQNVFTGADRTAAETARDAFDVATPGWIESYNNNTGLNIRLEFAATGDQVALYQVRNVSGTAWQDNSSAVGVKGDTGPAGATGNSYFFASLDKRDDFFNTPGNPTLLESGLPNITNTGSNAVTVFEWKGEDQPASYDNTLWRDSSFRAGTGEFIAGDLQSISSAGDTLAVVNLLSGIAFHPVWQTFDDGNTSFVRVRFPLPDVNLSDKTANLINPTWSLPATNDETIRTIKADFVTSPIDLIIDLKLNGSDFSKRNHGSFSIGEQVITLKTPIDAKTGQTITVSVSDGGGDGNVTVKGNSISGVPFQVVTLSRWVDTSVALQDGILTQGSIPFVDDTGTLTEDNVDFFWDDTNNRLGIGTNTPDTTLTIQGNLDKQLTGTLSVTIGTAAVTGSGTLFLSEINQGSTIEISGEIFTVTFVSSDVTLTLDSNHVTGASNVTATTDPDAIHVVTSDSRTTLKVSSGQVGIGTDTPVEALHIQGNNQRTRLLLENLSTLGSNQVSLSLVAGVNEWIPFVTADLDQLRIFSGSAGIILTLDASGEITGPRFTETDASNVVNVYTSADLPTLLVDGVNYILHGPITLTTGEELTLPAGRVEINTTNVTTNTLTYSGTGTLLNGTGIVSFGSGCEISSTGTGTLFGLTGNGTDSLIFWTRGGFNGWSDLGTITSFPVTFFNQLTVTSFEIGLNFVTSDTFLMSQSNWFNLSDQNTDYFTFDANIKEINVNSSGLRPIGSERIFNINSGSSVSAFINNIQFVSSSNLYFNATGFDKTSPGVIVKDCSNIPDSITFAELFLNGNSASTDIPAVGALVEIAVDVNWTDGVERMTVGIDGSATLNAFNPSRLTYTGSINLEPANASKLISLRVVNLNPTSNIVTFVSVFNNLNIDAHGLSNGDNVSFKDTAGTLPSEIRADVTYFVVNAVLNSFQLSYTLSGSFITFSDNGSGTNSYKVATLNGATPTNSVSAGSPRDLIPQASINAIIGSKSFVVVINNDDEVNITVNSGYQLYNG